MSEGSSSIATGDAPAPADAPPNPPARPVSLAELDADWPTLTLLSSPLHRPRPAAHARQQDARRRHAGLIDRRTLNRIMARDRARKARPGVSRQAKAAE